MRETIPSGDHCETQQIEIKAFFLEFKITEFNKFPNTKAIQELCCNRMCLIFYLICSFYNYFVKVIIAISNMLYK